MPRSLSKMGLDGPVYASYVHAGAAAGQLDAFFFVADDYYEVIEIRCNHSVDGGASAAVAVRKCNSAEAIASGDAIGLTGFTLSSGALTPQRRSLSAGTLSATTAHRMLVPGDSLAVDFSGTLTSLVGPAVTVVMTRTRKTTQR